MTSYVKFEKLNLKTHLEFNEHWVQDRIAEDPSILGLGDVILKDKERIQPRAGRLDLLLQEADGNRRYEVEVQLGFTDESHIIRTIEYWATHQTCRKMQSTRVLQQAELLCADWSEIAD